MAKTSLHTHMAVARLPGIKLVFLVTTETEKKTDNIYCNKIE